MSKSIRKRTDEDAKMTRERYLDLMLNEEREFSFVWNRIVSNTNKYLRDNPGFDISDTSLDLFVDDLCLSGAWIKDRLNGKCGLPGHTNYRGSLSKKIRKALGYTY